MIPIQPLDIHRGCLPTPYQAHVELLVDAAERALDGVSTGLGELVPKEAWLATMTLCQLLAESSAGMARMVGIRCRLGRQQRVCGVRLAVGRKRNETGEELVLVTHLPVALAGEANPEEQLLQDGFGPPPLQHLDGTRFRRALPGLLRLVEREAAFLVHGEDYNWGDIDGRDDAFLDEKWLPEQMLRRIRTLRVEVRRLETVRAIQEE